MEKKNKTLYLQKNQTSLPIIYCRTSNGIYMKIFLELISELSKFTGNNINIQKSIPLLYTRSKALQIEIKQYYFPEHQNYDILRDKSDKR